MNTGMRFVFEEWREELFRQNRQTLMEMAVEVHTSGADLEDCLFLCVDADDETWTELATQLTPHQDWDALRKQEQAAIALACVDMDDTVGIILRAHPDVADELLVPPIFPCVRVVVLSRGVSLYDLEVPCDRSTVPEGTRIH